MMVVELTLKGPRSVTEQTRKMQDFTYSQEIAFFNPGILTVLAPCAINVAATFDLSLAATRTLDGCC